MFIINYFTKRSLELEQELINNRRILHQYPELGSQLLQTSAFVTKKLREMGCETTEIPEGGVVCHIGKNTGKTIMLRADMDALPIQEQSGLTFSSCNEGVAHCCGHDIHTSFLLGAAKMLKEREHELSGTVKLVFQTGEEPLEGAKNMIAANVLEDPHVDCAVGIHVQPLLPLGCLNYPRGAFLCSSDILKIQVFGKGGHGGLPHLGIDPINIAAHIILSLQSLQIKEISADSPVVLNICEIKAGSSCNIIPESAVLIGTLRTYDPQICCKLKKRIIEMCESTATTFGGSALVTFEESCPCVINNSTLVEQLSGYIPQLEMDFITESEYKMQVSDDFGFFSEQTPSVMFIIGCESTEGSRSFNHSPSVRYNEGVLPIGAALLAHLAFSWLNDRR